MSLLQHKKSTFRNFIRRERRRDYFSDRSYSHDAGLRERMRMLSGEAWGHLPPKIVLRPLNLTNTILTAINNTMQRIT